MAATAVVSAAAVPVRYAISTVNDSIVSTALSSTIGTLIVARLRSAGITTIPDAAV